MYLKQHWIITRHLSCTIDSKKWENSQLLSHLCCFFTLLFSLSWASTESGDLPFPSSQLNSSSDRTFFCLVVAEAWDSPTICVFSLLELRELSCLDFLTVLGFAVFDLPSDFCLSLSFRLSNVSDLSPSTLSTMHKVSQVEPSTDLLPCFGPSTLDFPPEAPPLLENLQNV